MVRTKFLIESFVRKSLLVILASILLLTPIVSGTEVARGLVKKLDKQKILRRVAQNWIQVGTEQYKRGFHKQAKQSLVRALDYQEHLTAGQREKLNELWENIHTATLEKEIAELYSRGVEFYRAGQLEKAREGSVKVARNGLLVPPAGKTAEGYIVRTVDKSALGTLENELPGVGEEPTRDTRINRKRKILRSYAIAVVTDAIAKTQNYVNEGKFYKAKEAVEAARQALNKNQLYLGEELFKQYSSQLKQLAQLSQKAKPLPGPPQSGNPTSRGKM